MSLRVVHRLPGRFRVQAPELRDNSAALERIERGIGALAGIRTASGNPITGTVLVEYDPQSHDESTLVDRIAQASGLRIEKVGAWGAGAPIPALAQAIQEPFGRLNAGLFEFTKGNLDLRYMVPLLFAGYGTLKLIRQGPVPSIPWYLLYWWSFRMFVILNRQSERAVP
jgi:hypothetical protein